MRVLYLFAKPRQEIYNSYIAGSGPDNLLFGLNHMAEYDVCAEFRDKVSSNNLLNHVYWFFHRIMYHFTGLGFDLSQAVQKIKHINQCDVVFATTDSIGLPIAFLKMLGIIDTPLVIASQGLTSHLKARGMNLGFRLNKKLLNHADKVICYGWGEKNELLQYFDVPKDKLIWIPLGTDTDFFSPADVPVNNVILSVGRDTFRDYATLLRVASHLPYQFQIITSPRNLHGLSIPSNVKTIFDVPIGTVKEHISKSRLIVLPLKNTGYSAATTTLLQCLSMARPVILTNVDALGPDRNGYCFSSNKAIYLVSPENPEALKQAVCELWNQPDMALELGQRGRKTVVNRFTTRHMAAHLSKVFMEVSN